MPRYVALFRGINVGKAKRIAMADLRVLLEGLKFTDVKTLLNSGNAVFSGKTESATKIADRIRKAVHAQLGVEASVIVKSQPDIAAVLADNALERVATDDSRLLVVMSATPRAFASLADVVAADWGREKLHAGQHAAFVWCAIGILESKVAPAMFKRLDADCTTRNWATIKKIHALMESA